MAKPRLILGCNIRERPKQIHGLADQVIKIKSLGSLQLSLIAVPHLDEQRISGVLRVGGPAIRLNVGEFVFEPRHFPDDGVGGKPHIVTTQLFEDSFHQGSLISGVINREGAGISKTVMLFAQNSNTRGVEGGYPHSTGRLTDESGDALPHLAGRFVGEGNGQDLTGPRISGLQQTGNTPGQHAGLTRARTGDNQQCRTPIAHRLPLARVQPVNQGRRRI